MDIIYEGALFLTNIILLARNGGEETYFVARGIDGMLAGRWSLIYARWQETTLLI
jgi:hypothetical protein